jgi:hypothetical protein
MSFAEEVRTVSAERSKHEMPPPASEPVKPEMLDPTAELQQPAPVSATPTPTPPAEPATPAKMRVRIGAKEFDNTEDALAYAQELELQNAQNEGYQRAVETLKPKDAPVVTKPIADEISEIIFEDPKQAIIKLTELIDSTVNKKADEIRADEARKAQLNNVWNDFYQSNPELQAHDAFVQHLLQNVHWKELAYIPSSQAMSKLAEIAKRELKIVRESTLPETTLPAGRAIVAPTSQTATPAPVPIVEEPVDFVSQVNNIRKRVKR